MRILGVDPGSRACGWAILEMDSVPALLSWGVIRVSPETPLPARLLALGQKLWEVIEEHSPELAAIERVFYGVNPQSLITLGQARGALVLTLARASVPIEELSPTEVKKAVTGNGRATKWQVRTMVGMQLCSQSQGRGLPLDAADGAAVAFAAALRRKAASKVPVSGTQREISDSKTAPSKETTWKRRPAG